MGDTFLTQPDLPEPEGMSRVREEHSRLQGVVFSLNKRISQVLAKQEGDFLAAYRAHMYTVQKELQTLRQRVVEAENVLQVWFSVRYPIRSKLQRRRQCLSLKTSSNNDCCCWSSPCSLLYVHTAVSVFEKRQCVAHLAHKLLPRGTLGLNWAQLLYYL